jgi:N utilization substance protein B
MGTRRRSRELAMQALFHMDMNANLSEDQLELYLSCFPPSKKTHTFFLKLVRGVIRAGSELDSVIERFSSNWKISRMSCVDRNVLRLAVFEMLYCKDIPAKVSINEAIDVGKKFGTEESGAFINGILDSVRINIEKGQITVNPVLRITAAEGEDDDGDN